MTTREYRRILLDGNAVDVIVDGDDLVAGDGRRTAIADAVHLPYPAMVSGFVHGVAQPTSGE